MNEARLLKCKLRCLGRPQCIPTGSEEAEFSSVAHETVAAENKITAAVCLLAWTRPPRVHSCAFVPLYSIQGLGT